MCESVDTGNDLSCIFAETVQDNAKRFRTNFVRLLSDTDSAFSCCERLMTGEECEALCLFFQKHLAEIAVAKTYFTTVSN